MLYQVQIQGYIVWYKNKIKEGSNITNRLNGFIFTYNDELGDFKCRLAQPFQAYNQVADLIEKTFRRNTILMVSRFIVKKCSVL